MSTATMPCKSCGLAWSASVETKLFTVPRNTGPRLNEQRPLRTMHLKSDKPGCSVCSHWHNSCFISGLMGIPLDTIPA